MKNSKEILMFIRWTLADIGLNENDIKRILDDAEYNLFFEHNPESSISYLFDD